MELHGKNFLGSERTRESGETFQAVDPASGETLAPPFFEATDAEIDRAATEALAVFEAEFPVPTEKTVKLLRRMAEEVEALGDALVERACAETGLPATRIKMERGRTVGQLRLMADVVEEGSWVEARIDRAQPRRRPMPKPDLRRMLVPLGSVAAFGASNFPLAFSAAGGDTASALAAGNPVVVKAHPAHPGTSELVAEAVARAVRDAELPPAWFSMVHARRPAASLALARHPAIRAVGFTGSLRAGRAIFDAAAARPDPIPVYAEMGSTNPVFLLPEAIAQRGEELAAGLHGSVTLGVGQFCTNPGIVVALDGDDLQRLLKTLAQLMRQSPVGTMLHRGICQAYAQGIERLAGIGGVEVLVPRKDDTGPTGASAALLTTTAETFLAQPDLASEVFGPSTLVVRCESAQRMLDVARSLSGQLTATIHGSEADLAAYKSLRAVLQQRVGRLLFGGFPTGVEVCPSMQHGGPYPATTDSRTTSVGTAAVARFARPVCYQDCPDALLPPELQDANPRGILRMVEGKWELG